jgi:hypothetical protein
MLIEGHDWRDIWMVEREDLDNLVLEARYIVRVGGEDRSKYRNRNRAICIQFQPTVHIGWAAAPEQLLQLILAKPFTAEQAVVLSHMSLSISHGQRPMRCEERAAMQPMIDEGSAAIVGVLAYTCQ